MPPAVISHPSFNAVDTPSLPDDDSSVSAISSAQTVAVCGSILHRAPACKTLELAYNGSSAEASAQAQPDFALAVFGSRMVRDIEKLDDPTVGDHRIIYLFIFPHPILDPNTA
ncbi:hypothetical protein Acr_24g0012590 [Actinidia rufa]|uniref:Uncharacterized protein n=1 Tax=Actinidia rufa TaxID=165716 RepID=A0A7J0GW55_9ERIC|nr:hypothetical protein Acr_24g0012590 [Actinidia rufa]